MGRMTVTWFLITHFTLSADWIERKAYVSSQLPALQERFVADILQRLEYIALQTFKLFSFVGDLQYM